MKWILRRTAAYFFRGLIFITPLAIIGWVIWYLFNLSKSIPFFQDKPWLGILLLLLGTILVGLIISSFVVRPVLVWFERILVRTPLIKLIYTSIKDLLEAFVGEKKKFNHPVLVTLYRDEEIQRIGFITDEDLSSIGLEGKVAVYIPMSYSFSGNLYIVPASRVQALDGISPADAMKFVVSGGVTRTADEILEESQHPSPPLEPRPKRKKKKNLR